MNGRSDLILLQIEFNIYLAKGMKMSIKVKMTSGLWLEECDSLTEIKMEEKQFGIRRVMVLIVTFQKAVKNSVTNSCMHWSLTMSILLGP